MTSPPRRSAVVPQGRLTAAMLRAMAAGLSDPGRYGRAKAYARDGAVVRLDVAPGVIRGEIQGSRYDPYVTHLHVQPVDDADGVHDPNLAVALLVPDLDDLTLSCSCPDDDGTGGACKHALAALLVFADRVSEDPSLLVRWRSGSSRRSGGTAPASTAPPVDVLAPRLAAPARLPAIPTLTPVERRPPVTDELTDVLLSALDVLADRG